MFKKIRYRSVFILRKLLNSFLLGFQRILNVTHNYQPNPFINTGIDLNNSYARYKDITINIEAENISLIDLGCNRGFFPLIFAKNHKLITSGVDHDWFELEYAKSMALKEDIGEAVFFHSEIDLSFLHRMPSYDLVICTSIFHHWVKNFGEETAFEMMEIIASKTKKYLVFETGQSNENDTTWFKKLSFMGDDPESWIKDYLLSLGFSNVKPTGKYSKNLTPVKRTMFIGYK